MFKQSNSFTKLINEASNEISPVILQDRIELCSMIYYKEFIIWPFLVTIRHTTCILFSKSNSIVCLSQPKWKLLNQWTLWSGISHHGLGLQSSCSCSNHIILAYVIMTLLPFLVSFSCRISNITMETAVEEESSEVRKGMARLIESCICPIGYTGLSCQVMVPLSPWHLMEPFSLYFFCGEQSELSTKLIDQQNLTDCQLRIIRSFHCINLCLASVSLTFYLSIHGMSPSPTRPPLSLSTWPASLHNLSLSYLSMWRSVLQDFSVSHFLSCHLTVKSHC